MGFVRDYHLIPLNWLFMFSIYPQTIASSELWIACFSKTPTICLLWHSKKNYTIQCNPSRSLYAIWSSCHSLATWTGLRFFFYAPTLVTRWRRCDQIRAKKLVFPSHLMYRQETWWSGNTISGNPLDELANNIPWIV